MVYYKDGKYNISDLKVHYKEEFEGEIIKFVGQEGKNWWGEFARMWGDTFKLIKFIEAKPTQEQLERLDKVNELGLPEGISFVNEYITESKFEKELENGVVINVDRGHPLYVLRLEEDLETLGEDNAELVFEQAMLELRLLDLEEMLND